MVVVFDGNNIQVFDLWHREYCWITLLEKLIMHVMTQHVVLHKEMILRTILVLCLNGCASYVDDPLLPTDFSCALLPERVKSYLLCCLCLSLPTWLSQALKIYAASGWCTPFCTSANLYLHAQWYMKTADLFCSAESRTPWYTWGKHFTLYHITFRQICFLKHSSHSLWDCGANRYWSVLFAQSTLSAQKGWARNFFWGILIIFFSFIYISYPFS